MATAFIMLPIMLLLALTFGAVMYRAACSLLNALSGKSTAVVDVEVISAEPITKRPVAPTKGVDNPYASPRSTTPVKQLTRTALPMPSFAKAMGIVFVGGLAQFGINLISSGVGTTIDESINLGMFAVFEAGLRLVLGWLAVTLLGQAWLPTSFGKAALVALIYSLLMILLVFGIGLLVAVSIGFRASL